VSVALPILPDPNPDARNRRVLRVILGVVAVLALATFLAGIRW
jgi:hypothetical protein